MLTAIFNTHKVDKFALIYFIKFSRNNLSQIFYSQPKFSIYARMLFIEFSKRMKNKITQSSRPFW